MFKYKQKAEFFLKKCMKFFATGSKCITMHHPPVKLPNLKWEFKRALKAQTQIQEQKQIQMTNIRLKSCMKYITVHNMKPLKVAGRKTGSLQRRVWNRSKNNLSNTIGENYMEQITMHHTDPLKGAASKAARRRGGRACTRQMAPIQCCLHFLGQFCKCNLKKSMKE